VAKSRRALIRHIRAAEEFAAIGGGHHLELMGLGEIRTWRAIGMDDAFGQKVQHLLSLLFWHISSEKVVEGAILADDDDDMLDQSPSLDRIALVIPIVIISGSRRCAEAKNDIASTSTQAVAFSLHFLSSHGYIFLLV
jgi:hypothetical protein